MWACLLTEVIGSSREATGYSASLPKWTLGRDTPLLLHSIFGLGLCWSLLSLWFFNVWCANPEMKDAGGELGRTHLCSVTSRNPTLEQNPSSPLLGNENPSLQDELGLVEIQRSTLCMPKNMWENKFKLFGVWCSASVENKQGKWKEHSATRPESRLNLEPKKLDGRKFCEINQIWKDSEIGSSGFLFTFGCLLFWWFGWLNSLSVVIGGWL